MALEGGSFPKIPEEAEEETSVYWVIIPIVLVLLLFFFLTFRVRKDEPVEE